MEKTMHHEDPATMKYAFIEYEGERRPLLDVVKELNLEYNTVKMRYRRGKRGAALLAPTRSTPKPIDLEAFLGAEVYAKLVAQSDYLQLSPVVLVRHILDEWCRSQK